MRLQFRFANTTVDFSGHPVSGEKWARRKTYKNMFHSNQKLPTAAPPNYNSSFQDVQQQQLNYQSAFANNFGTNAGTGLVTHQPGKVLNFDKY